MTIHVTIGEAEKRLAELVDAAVRGEEVLLSGLGGTQVKLAPVAAPVVLTREEEEARVARRQNALGMWRHLATDRDIDIRRLKMTDEEWEERDRKRFGDPD